VTHRRPRYAWRDLPLTPSTVLLQASTWINAIILVPVVISLAVALTLAGCFEGPKGDPAPESAQGPKDEKGEKGDPGKDGVGVPAAKQK
jgi:hypothetical protein